MKYYFSSDFVANEMLNKEAVLDKHIKNATYCENINFDFVDPAYYQFSLDKKEKIKEIWLFFKFYKIANTDDIVCAVSLFNDDWSERISYVTKSFNFLNGKNYIVLTKYDFSEIETQNVEIRFIFSGEQIHVDKVRLELNCVGINEKIYAPIVEQDEIVLAEYVPAYQEPIYQEIYWGSFGWGDFGETFFGQGIKR